MDAERRTQIIALLESHDDHLPLPVRRDHSTRGFVHKSKHRASCPDCLANDKVMFGCETCGGTGYTEEYEEHDPYAITKVQPYGLDERRHERAAERDREIDRLAAAIEAAESSKTEQDLIAEANKHPYGWEVARRLMYLRYDHGALDAALEHLRDRDETAYSLVHSVSVYGWLEPATAMEAAVERALVFIDERMPDVIRAPGDPEHPAMARQRRRDAA